MTIEEIRRISALAGLICHPIWRGDDGSLRIGHSGDMVQFLEDMKMATVQP
jgi:hypothetical protein